MSDPEVGKRGKSGHKTAWFNAASVTASHAETVHLTVVPNATGRKHLSRNRSTHVLVQVKFTPPGGQPSTRTITISWR